MTEDKIKEDGQPAEENAAEPASGGNLENDGSTETETPPIEAEEDSTAISTSEESAALGNMQIDDLSDAANADPADDEETQAIEDFDLNLLLDIPLEITVELGRNRVRIQKLLELEPGSTVTLSKLEGEPVDILANDKLIARGEVVLQNKKYGIRITEITSRMNRIKSLH